MRRVLVLVFVLLSSCKAKDDYPIGPGGGGPDAGGVVDTGDAAHIDADASVSCSASQVQVDCVVTVTCVADDVFIPHSTCTSKSAPDYQAVKQTVIDYAMQFVDCSAGASYKVSCAAPDNSWDCPLGLEMQPNVSVCVPMLPYNTPEIADVCAHLQTTPPNTACAVACNPTALHPFMDPKNDVITAYTCQATNAAQTVYIAVAR